MKKFLTLFAVSLFLLNLHSAEFAKALNYRIILPEKATAIEKSAAEELKFHLSKSYKKAVKINGKTPKLINFFVGCSAESSKAGLIPRYKGEFCIVRKGNDFLFTGHDSPRRTIYRTLSECGTFHSVAYFVQKYMGVKIFMPGPQGMKHASEPEIIFAGDMDVPVPSYSLRGFQTAGKGCPPEDSIIYFRRRLGRIPSWTKSNWSYRFLYTWGERFKDRPEMFGLFNGRRVNEKYPRHFPCTSNPAVLDQVEKDIADALKKRPGITSIRFFADAPVRSCECTNCRNSPAGKLVTESDNSETVYAFFSKIGHRIQKYKKGVFLHIQTKGMNYYQVPRTEKLPPNTVISVLTGHFITPDYAKTRELCDSWRKAGARVLLYAYPRAPEMQNFPVMNPHRIAEFFKKFHGAAEGSSISEGRARIPYSFSALNTYVQSAVMFDVKADPDKLIDEFCRLAAPRSSGELKNFYTTMEKLLEGAGFRADPRFNCYRPDRMKNAQKYLAAALKKDPGNQFLKQLSADFSLFIKSLTPTGPAAERYFKAVAAHDAAAAQRKLVKLSEQAVEFPFVPFVLYDDFQDAAARLSQEKQNFKFRITCRENQIKTLRAACRKNNSGDLWSDDVVELFLAPAETLYPYIHLALNSRGIYRVQLNTAPGKAADLPDFKVKTQAGVSKDRWFVEGVISLPQLKSVMNGKRMQLGICRNRPGIGKRKTQLSGVQRSATGAFHSASGRFTVEFR